MKKACLVLTLLLLGHLTQAQKKKNNQPISSSKAIAIPLQPDRWTFSEGKVEFIPYKGGAAMKILPEAGPVVLKDQDFSNGTIEFDMETIDPRFASFYFRWKNKDENECFYFRTARAGHPLAGDAVQYAPLITGVNLWDMLGYYQTNAVIKTKEWNHVKLVISGLQMRVYVNSSDRPTLEIPRLEGNNMNGTLAFEGQMIVANVVVKPNEIEGLSPEPGLDPTNYDPRYIRSWQVSQPITTLKGVDFSVDYILKQEAAWETIQAERRGLINLTRKFGKSETRRRGWLKVNLKSTVSQKRRVDLGFSDEVWVFVNGRFLYVDKNLYGQPIMKEPDGRCSVENASFILPLNAGNNELLIGVANDFYGWGIIARLDSMEGIAID